jgi:hypothetical protein
MHNLKFIEQRFPKHQKTIVRILFGLMVLAFVVGVAIAFWNR